MSDTVTTKKKYIAGHTGWIAGQRVTEGEELMLYPAQARGENVRPASPAKGKASPKERAEK